MPKHTHAEHCIRIAAPIAQCHRFFTPAGEELWVDGWSPAYLHPETGKTERGQVFTTGAGEDFTIWTTVDFDTASHTTRFARVTPALRAGTVEVRCKQVDGGTTDVTVTYTLTALTAKGEQSLEAFEGPPFVDMIEGWKRLIDAKLAELIQATIR